MEDSKMLFQRKEQGQIKKIFDLHNQPFIIAGPCSVESLDQVESVAKLLNEYKISFIRGGAYKPRTSPYSFQGY